MVDIKAIPKSTASISASVRVAEDLERKILDGTLPKGTHLVERTFCEEYSVSRTVVREALLKLASRCLIEIVPDAGATVASFPASKIRDAYVFREAIESAAAEQSAVRMNREQTEALTQCASRFSREYALNCQRKPNGLFALEIQFHRSIIDGSGNEFLRNGWEIAQVCMSQALGLRPDEEPLPGMREASVDDHVGIAQAIRDGNAEAAGTLMSLHIRSGRDLLIERMKYAGISSLTPN